jgi:hypothetical protein
MKPLGNERQNSLSRTETLRLRKADKARGRQNGKKEVEKELAGMSSFIIEDDNVRSDS